MEKRLYRSRKERMIAGVAGGLAEYFGVDPTPVRLLFVLAGLINGLGLIIYLALWLITPEAPVTEGTTKVFPLVTPPQEDVPVEKEPEP